MAEKIKEEDKRLHRLKVSFTSVELAQIKEKAKAAGLATARYLRESGLNSQITTRRFTEEERNHYRILSGLANNINQLTKEYHSGSKNTGQIDSYLTLVGMLMRKMLEHDR